MSAKDQDNSIEVSNLSKGYRIYFSPWGRLKEKMPWNRRQQYREVKALHDVSFEVPKGTCVGLIGSNGAGKSTLLKILSGTTYPTGGSFRMRGRVASLLELGAGFNQNFSGRENIFMNAALMGFGRKEAQKRYQAILDFSELHDFINAPIRTYSSGMRARLGFSVAIATDPDVLIIDEILAVGDMHFRKKCVDRILSFKERGKTMFFCSHSLYDVRQICDLTLWLKQGVVQMYADSDSVTNAYSTYETQLSENADNEDLLEPWDEERSGPKPEPMIKPDMPRILSARLVDGKTRKPRSTFEPFDDVAIQVHFKNGEQFEKLNLAVGFRRKGELICTAMMTHFDDVSVEAQEAVVTLTLPKCPLLAGEFVVPVWLLDKNGVHRFHQLPTEENLIVQNSGRLIGVFSAEHRWEVDVVEGPPG